jgi:hypothetical protein
MAANGNPEARHEERDVNALAVTKFGIGLALTVIVSMFVLWGLLNYFKNRVAAELPAPSASRAAADMGKLPPEPRLQDNPRTDLQAIRAAEEKLLHSYGWVDQEKGIVRIPIERAIDTLAERGLPARPQSEGTK